MKTKGNVATAIGLALTLCGLLYLKGPAVKPMEILAGFALTGLGFFIVWLRSWTTSSDIKKIADSKSTTSDSESESINKIR